MLLVREMQSIDFNVVREVFDVLETLSTNTGSIIHTRIKHFEAKEKNNAEFQFISNYMEMVAVLFKFQYASKSRDCMLRLSVVQDMTSIIISMGGIEYQRLLPVYLSEMRNLEYNDHDIWEDFMAGGLSIQTTKVPHTAIGVDHAGEQQNKKLEIQDGLIGITTKENSRSRYFIISPVISQIVNEMEEIGNCKTSEQILHHYRRGIQSKCIISLVNKFDSPNLQFTDAEDDRLFHIVTGRIFPNIVRDHVRSSSMNLKKNV